MLMALFMFRFLSVSASIVGFSLLCSAPLFAEQVVDVGSTFKCYFLNSGDSKYNCSSDTTWTSEQIDAVTRALSTWDSLIKNTPGRTINVGLYWVAQAESVLASAYSPSTEYLAINKLQKCSTIAESVWRDHSSAEYTTSFDIRICCNSANIKNFYYDVTPMSEGMGLYDFQTLITHELGHTFGFMSFAQDDGTFETYTGTTGSSNSPYSATIYTAFDALMTNAAGERIINEANGGAKVFNLGETLTLSDTGLTVYNPSYWQSGSSMCHVGYMSENAVMKPAIFSGETIRTLSDAEIALMSAMGWDMIPEPSSATLSLLGIFSLLWRRKRH